MNIKDFYNKHLKYQLKVLFTPSCWFQVKPYSEKWDNKLNSLLKNPFLYNVTQFEGTLYDELNDKKYIIWIENHPYGSFVYNHTRPKRTTILKAMDLLKNFINKANDDDDYKNVTITFKKGNDGNSQI